MLFGPYTLIKLLVSVTTDLLTGLSKAIDKVCLFPLTLLTGESAPVVTSFGASSEYVVSKVNGRPFVSTCLTGVLTEVN
ncbi:hypothetical protein D3C77_427490 [compost metagenome]